jgi:hypothetical protein
MKNEYLEEIWQVREKLAARYGYDLHRMVQHLRKAQAKHGDRLVRAPGVDVGQTPRTKSRQKTSALHR